jgi:amidase
MPHLWWALGTTGPLTRTVRDSALVHDVIRGNLTTDRFPCPEPASSLPTLLSLAAQLTGR